MTISGRKKVDPAAFKGTDIPLMARVNGLANVPLVQANVNALTRNVYVKGQSPGTPEALTPISTYVYNTLQTTDAAWTEDTIGYNVKDTLPNTKLASGDVTYYVDYEITDSNSKKIAWGFEIPSINR